MIEKFQLSKILEGWNPSWMGLNRSVFLACISFVIAGVITLLLTQTGFFKQEALIVIFVFILAGKWLSWVF